MPFERSPLDQHLSQVEKLEAAGIELPADWLALRSRYLEFRRMQTPQRQKLIEAIITGEGDVEALRAAAFGEATLAKGVVDAVEGAVDGALRDAYSPAAYSVYRAVAAQFDGVAAAYAEAAGVVDPDARAEAVVTASDQQREAWARLPLLGSQLDALAVPLRAAAELAGSGSLKAREAQLGLTVDPRAANRRKLWEAFESGGRAGRWASVIGCGAWVRAAALDGFQPYRRPLPEDEAVSV